MLASAHDSTDAISVPSLQTPTTTLPHHSPLAPIPLHPETNPLPPPTAPRPNPLLRHRLPSRLRQMRQRDRTPSPHLPTENRQRRRHLRTDRQRQVRDGTVLLRQQLLWGRGEFLRRGELVPVEVGDVLVGGYHLMGYLRAWVG